MTGRPSGRCAATEALKVMEEEGLRDGNLVFFPADSWHALRAALASPCCVSADQEQVKAWKTLIEEARAFAAFRSEMAPVVGDLTAAFTDALALLGSHEEAATDV